MNLHRVAVAIGLVRAVGPGPAGRVCAQWRAALAERPELVRDLMQLGFLLDDDVTDREGRPTPLPADELQFRAGARALARAIFARAGVTSEELMEAVSHAEQDDVLAGLVDPAEGAGR